MSSQGGWGSSKEFLDLVKAIGEAKSKAEEERIVTEEIETLKKRITEPDIPKRKMKEYIIRLVYVEMLGHDASFGYIHAVKMTHDDNLLLKKTGYLAVTLFLNEDHDLIILIINTIQKDLRSDNYLVCCTALTAICRLINEETIPAVLPQVVELLGHQKELVRKKAVMALHRFYQRSPATVSHLIPKFRQRLCDSDPSVMSASLCALFDLITTDTTAYKNLTASFVSILKQVVEHRLPKLYDYHRTPAPFIQIKLLKLLALLGVGDKQTSENMYSVLGDVLKRAEPNGNIGNAILYECICTITSIYPNPKLLEAAADITSKFLKNENHNLKYMGIDALGRVIKINSEFAEEHQLAVIDCLEDPDDTLKRKTLDLLYKMTKETNVEVIVERMISYMKTITDSHYKTEIASRCVELAEQFAPSNHWFIQTINQVFEHAGDLVPPKVAHDLMRLIAEGSGEEDEDADNQLRSSAVESYLQILAEPKLPSTLLQVICWVLGEYGTADGSHSATYIIGKLCDVVGARPSDNVVKGYAITAIAKVCAFEISAGRKVDLIPECQAFMDELLASHSTDLQQRAYELQASLLLNHTVLASIMPMDASCEDIEVDKDLPFLNGFVEASLLNGARPYMKDKERLQTGASIASLTNRRENSSTSTHTLRFDPYEMPKPPPLTTTSISAVSHLQNDEFRLETVDARTVDARAPNAHQTIASAPNVDLHSDDVQLRLDGVQKKWGRQTYNTSSIRSSDVSGSQEKPINGFNVSGTGKVSSNIQETAYESRYVGKSKQPEISPEKQKLAASLFGGSSKKSVSASKTDVKGQMSAVQKVHLPEPTNKKVQSRHVSASTQMPQPATVQPPELLDLSEEPPVTICKDPFKELEGLLEMPVASDVPVTAVDDHVATGSTIDLLSLYGASDPSLIGGMGNTNLVDLISGIGVVEPVNDLPTTGHSSGALMSKHSHLKKGPSTDGSLQRDAVSRQVGVNPTGLNVDLFKDLLG